jgi:hypothetical protein
MNDPIYGVKRYCIEFPVENKTKTRDAYLTAEKVVVQDGDVLFYGRHRRPNADGLWDEPTEQELTLLVILPKGSFKYIYACSGLDGSAVAFDYWENRREVG